VELVPQVEQLLSAKFLETVPQRNVRFDVDREIHKSLFPYTLVLTSLALGNGDGVTLEHLLDPRLEIGKDKLVDQLIDVFFGHS